MLERFYILGMNDSINKKNSRISKFSKMFEKNVNYLLIQSFALNSKSKEQRPLERMMRDVERRLLINNFYLSS